MKFSIITATYNRAGTLARALHSAQSQAYPSKQLIIVDGNSRDNTVAIAKQFLTSEDVLIVEDDDGIYDALNKGVSVATGDIICFLHSDDYYPNSTVLEDVASVMEEKSCPVVYGNAEFFDQNDHEKTLRRYKSRPLTVKNLAWGHMPAHPAIFYRREFFDEIGLFDTSYDIAADYEWLCRLAKRSAEEIYYLDLCLMRMQVGGASRFGLRNTYNLNREVYRALKANNIKTNIIMILSKYIFKVWELTRTQ